MSIASVSIAWAFLQITLICALSLSIAVALRGRRPQLVSAILSGTCVASLILAMISLVPPFQWTLAIDARLPTSLQTAEPNAKPNDDVSAQSDQTKAKEHVEQRQPLTIEQVVAPNPSEKSDRAALLGSSGFNAIHHWISQYIQRMDREVREVEEWQQPVASARNFSLLLAGLIGLSGMSLLWFASWIYMRRILRCSQPVTDHAILSCVESQAKAFGLRRVPLVLESSLVPIGATVGWRHVTVLLHTDWREWSCDEKTAVIAHELAHAVRHDFAWVIICSWTRILLFFHPLVHVLNYRMRLEQELAADQLAAGKVGSAKAYGRALASLALRSQQSLGTSNAKFGSMLAAGQICVTRRVLMLRQGSLKPISSQSRWSMLAVAAIVCTAIPLAGLRGTTQEPIVSKTSPTDEPKESDLAEETKPKPLSEEFLAAYPPVEFKGLMIYRPGRFRAGEFGPEAAWVQEWFAISALGKPMPDRAVIHGECTGITRWTDEERKHGRFDLGASFREGESTEPGQLAKLADPCNFQFEKFRTVSTEQVDGRTLAGVTKSPTSDEPKIWLIDDEQGYFLGSHEQATQYVRGQRFALDAIPENFREDYQNSAFAMVYDHCDQWPKKLEAFSKGSPREQDFQVFGFQPPISILKELKQIGVFVDGCKAPACCIRAVVQDAHAATRLAAQMKTLVELGKVAVAIMPSDEDNFAKEASGSILASMQITARESEVYFQFDIFIPSFADGPIRANHSVAGWINVNSDSQCKAVNSVTVRPESYFSSQPSLIGQTLDASDYRGKTVMLQLEIQCNEEAACEAGAFVWASRQEHGTSVAYSERTPRQQGSPYTGHRVLTAKTMAANGSSTWSESLKAERRLHLTTLSADAPSRILMVPLQVPSDAEHVSFGCYSKNSEIRVSKVRFEVKESISIQAVSQGDVMDATEHVPYNVLVVPGYAIRKSPVELNFEQSAPKAVEFAARQNESEVK